MLSFRFGVGLVAAVTAGLLVPTGVAYASTGVVVFAGSNRVSIVASAGVANRITVNYSGGLLFVSDPSDTVTNSGGCTNGPNNSLQCPVAEFFTLTIDAGSILGNTLRGGNGNDIIDVLDGVEGNDTCVIDDGDGAVNCEQ